MTGSGSSRSAACCSEHGVKIAPSGYYAFKQRPPAARTLREAEFLIEIERVFWDRDLGRGISGYRKIWHLLRRQGIAVADARPSV